MFLADLTTHAPTLFKVLNLDITNSIIFTWIIALVIFFVLRVSTRKMEEVPSGAQNLIESIIEFVQNFLNTILEPKVTTWAFPVIATFFLFILISNYTGLLPGVGSILWKSPIEAAKAHEKQGAESGAHKQEHKADSHSETVPQDEILRSNLEKDLKKEEATEKKWYESFPLYVSGSNHDYVPVLRPPTADANMTVAMALVFFFANAWWAIRYNGAWGLVNHIFGVKGGMKGFMFWVLLLPFMFVGVLEVISILIRPVALSMRLYGNIYGGESVLTIMLGLLPFGIAAIPFYFLELLVGTIQACVFTILSIAFTATLCSHSDDHGHDEEHADGKH